MWPRQSEIKTWSLCPWKKRSVPSIGSSYQNCLSSDKPKKLRYSVIENISSSRKMMKHLWVAVFIQVGDNGPCSHPSHHKIVNTTGYWKWGVSIERVTPRFRGSFSPSAHVFSYQVSLCFHSFHKEQPKRERETVRVPALYLSTGSSQTAAWDLYNVTCPTTTGSLHSFTAINISLTTLLLWKSFSGTSIVHWDLDRVQFCVPMSRW